MKQSLLTTNDNPFNPFDDFRSWYAFDTEKGYNSCGKLMRVAKVSDEMTDFEKMLVKYVDDGKYFAINCGRQYGKTTTLNMLSEYLKTDYNIIL